MNSKIWGIIGAVLCAAIYQLLRHGIGEWAGYVFAGALPVAGAVVFLFYQWQLSRISEHVDDMTDDERSRFLQGLDPELAKDLQDKEDKDAT